MNDISNQALIELALNLSNGLTSTDKYGRLLDTVKKTIVCDAVVLLVLEDEHLKPLALQGLSRDTLGRRFKIKEHPRFKQICASTDVVRFASDSPLPDPYDGLMMNSEANLPVHSCMGLPLLFEQQLIGVLTLDSFKQNQFERMPVRALQIISAMAATSLKTALLLESFEHRAQHSQLIVDELSKQVQTKNGYDIIGNSHLMSKLKHEIAIVSPSDLPILIEGETGTGKELVANQIHRNSLRANKPLVYVNCAALPEQLIESELFGHVKGSFTGADKSRPGKFSIANNGILFLDEIGELPIAAQGKLLRVLQEKEIQPVGKDNTIIVDVRVIAATNRDLKLEVENGTFRADLYHRISVFPVKVPPLRVREGDIEILCGFFLEKNKRLLGVKQLTIHKEAIEHLNDYDWPGNVRELEHVISSASLRAKARSKNPNHVTINTIDLGSVSFNKSILNQVPNKQHIQVQSKVISSELVDDENIHLKDATEQFQHQLIVNTLERFDGNWAASARALNVDRANLIRLAKRLGISIKKLIN